ARGPGQLDGERVASRVDAQLDLGVQGRVFDRNRDRSAQGVRLRAQVASRERDREELPVHDDGEVDLTTGAAVAIADGELRDARVELEDRAGDREGWPSARRRPRQPGRAGRVRQPE